MKNADGSVRQPGLDNHGMGSTFEELVRRFNEENNEEAGEHWTPRDAVRLMAKLVFLPVADEIQSGTYLLYDGACGTSGMLTVAEETLRQLAAEHGKDISTHLFGQEINAESEHAGDAEYSLVTRSSDRQTPSLLNKFSKVKQDTPLGSGTPSSTTTARCSRYRNE